MPEDLPQNVRSLIVDHIGSVLQVEILLLLQADAARAWSAADVGSELRIDPAWAAGQLDGLCARGTITCRQEPSGSRYHYGAASPELRAAVDGLVKAYSERRVTVIGLIHSKPADSIRSFADAFRLRRDKTDG